MVAKLGIVTLIGLLIIGIAGCVEEKNSTTSKPELTSEYKVECSPITEFGTAYLKVKVEGKAKDLKVMLSDPEGSTIDFTLISKDDLIDGIEAVKVAMSRCGETPKPGTYTLIIKQYFPEKVLYKEELTFSGAKVSVLDVEFETTFFEYANTYNISSLKLLITNNGDLPAIIDKIVIVIDDKESEIPFFFEDIPPKENKVIIEKPFLSFLDSGTYPVTIKLYSGQIELTSYETQIEL